MKSAPSIPHLSFSLLSAPHLSTPFFTFPFLSFPLALLRSLNPPQQQSPGARSWPLTGRTLAARKPALSIFASGKLNCTGAGCRGTALKVRLRGFWPSKFFLSTKINAAILRFCRCFLVLRTSRTSHHCSVFFFNLFFYCPAHSLAGALGRRALDLLWQKQNKDSAHYPHDRKWFSPARWTETWHNQMSDGRAATCPCCRH